MTAKTAWQPIETAPREVELLVGQFVNDEWRICQSGGNGSVWPLDCYTSVGLA